MNKKFVIIASLACFTVLFLSFAARDYASKRSRRLFDKANMKNKETLLNLAAGYKAKKDYVKTKNILKALIKKFPYSVEAKKARKDLEKLNIEILFSGVITDESLSYQIQPNDTLSKIAYKFNTTVELIKKANGLENDLILPGKFLKVSRAKFNIKVDKKTNTLFLKKAGGEIVKTYRVSTGKNYTTPVGKFNIEEKLVSPVWYKVGAIVAPDSQDYELGARWMGLSIEGYGIHGTNDPGTIGKYITKGCVRMTNGDVTELYAIVPSGTEVTIVE
jgi:lipoprotein-anchoring transpeptidase ErfK/SrfK